MHKEEKQAIERIKKLYKNGLDINKTPVVLTEDARCLGIVLNLIEKQEKMIDLMAEMINNHDIDEDLCKQMGENMLCESYTNSEACKNCIKQYCEKETKKKESE